MTGRRLGRCQRGAAAVEFAFLAPVMLALVLGVVEIGYALFTLNSLSRAISDTTRWAYTAIEADAAAGTEDAVRTHLIARAPWLGLAADEISVAYEGGGNCATSRIVVRVVHPYDALVGRLVPLGAITFDQSLSSPLQCWP